MSWMQLPKEYQKGTFTILPIEYEHNPTYGKGASKGSKEIIKASEHLEYYDEQFNTEPFLKGIKQLPTLNLNNVKPEEMIEQIATTIEQNQKEITKQNNFIITLGGDHAITLGVIKGLEQIHKTFSIIQLDAHADFRDSWSSPYNHACVAKQLSKNHDIALIGVRSMDSDEAKQLNQHKNVHLIKAYNLTKENIIKTLKKLNKKVYISIDVDVFDPSIITNTGTPEPGGLNWNQLIEILKDIFKHKTVIAADIVEFAPKTNYTAEAYTLAKLAYKLMALKAIKNSL
ncbi:agmatinase [Candidatus Woesearchaeota archaeon]|nr:agmatinase [Candidatus Woesearchaeota archaeon]|tara:strand:+ start:1120 stop:1977 length:858 start_codon:yes stop_codon:yes gene_type:complete